MAGSDEVMKVMLYLVWAELQLVSGETVTETQRHGCQVLPCQPTAIPSQQVSGHSQQANDSIVTVVTGRVNNVEKRGKQMSVWLRLTKKGTEHQGWGGRVWEM